MREPLLVLEDIHAAYLEREILAGLSLTVGRGEMVALEARNGAGKSTTLKVIGGLLPPTKGRILFDGVDVTSMTPPQRQAMGMGYLLQGARVFPNLTVQENLSIALTHVYKQGHSFVKAIEPGIVFPELEGRQRTRAGLLSGGQRQMLAIEMVLAQRPRFVLFDEPTAGLSDPLARSFLKGLARRADVEGQTVVLVEQNLAAAEAASPRRLSLRNGVLCSPNSVHGETP